VKYAVLFPGQGSQVVGMGAELFDARPDLLIDAADETLGWSLRDVCLNGPIEMLTATDRAQPALFALAYALWEAFAAAVEHGPAGAAGHSLGEYTAFGAAGAFSFTDGLALVSSRGAAMADAATRTESGMAALLGAGDDQAETIASDRREAGGHLWVANLNAPGQIVLAGAMSDIDWVVDNAGDLGVRRAVKLNVAGAFHSPLMDPAAAAVATALEATPFAPCAFPVWANATAEPVQDDAVLDVLKRQVVSPVRFSASLESMAQSGIETFVHIGPGDVTAGMAKRAAKGAEIVVVNTLDGIADAAATLGAG